MFAVAVSLVSGKILYISDQVASIFNYKRDVFSDAKFVEFLAPHDVGVFHSFTSPYKLPLWSVCSGAGEVIEVVPCFLWGLERGQELGPPQMWCRCPTSPFRAHLWGPPAACSGKGKG